MASNILRDEFWSVENHIIGLDLGNVGVSVAKEISANGEQFA